MPQHIVEFCIVIDWIWGAASECEEVKGGYILNEGPGVLYSMKVQLKETKY